MIIDEKNIDPESAKKEKKKAKAYLTWMAEIQKAQKRVKNWQKTAEKIVHRYAAVKSDGSAAKLDGGGAKKFRLNMFFSNVITLESMLYGSIPKVEVNRKYSDMDDDVSRVASETLERLLNSDLEENGKEVDCTLKACLQDRLLAGLGCAKVRYHVETGEDAETGDEYIVSESAPIDYYYWGDVLWGWSRNYAQLPWMAFRNYMSKEEVGLRFGEEVAEELDYAQRTVDIEEDKASDKQYESEDKQAEIWEIWDKKKRQVVWVCNKYEKVLDVKNDPLGLKGFFPAPPFFLANPTTTLYIPTPDYKQAEDLYNEVDTLQTRIAILTEAVKAVGVYDAGADGVQRIFTEGTDNRLIPIESWAAFAEKGGLRGCVEWLPLSDITSALDKLVLQRNDAIGLLQQITGMGDVMRGQLENQYEGVGQSSLKAKFGSVRVQALQDQFATFATDLLQLKAEVISLHFANETIIEKSHMQYSLDAELLPEAVDLIKDPKRAYLGIKIQSESMAMVDYAEIKAERTDFLNAMGTYMQSITPMLQNMPDSAPFLFKIMQWGLSGYKGAQQVESLMDKAIADAMQANEEAEANAENEPTPEELEQQRLAAMAQNEVDKINAKAESDMRVRDHDKRSDMETAQHQHVLDMRKIQAEAEATNMEIQNKAKAEAFKHVTDAEANMKQNDAATKNEIDKSITQSELKINEMLLQDDTDLRNMQETKEIEKDDD